VEVDVLVKRQNHAESMCSQERYALTQHQHQYEHAVEVQALSCNARTHAQQKRGLANQRLIGCKLQQFYCNLPQALATIINPLEARY
jgi:hypothetical protein